MLSTQNTLSLENLSRRPSDLYSRQDSDPLNPSNINNANTTLSPRVSKAKEEQARKVSIISGFDHRATRLSNRQMRDAASRFSMTMQSQVKMRQSIYAVGNKYRKNKKKSMRMSIAKHSVFRTCEPAVSLHSNRASAEKEAVRRAKIMSRSKASIFMKVF